MPLLVAVRLSVQILLMFIHLYLGLHINTEYSPLEESHEQLSGVKMRSRRLFRFPGTKICQAGNCYYTCHS
jgi:hypothetical protein